MVKIFSKQVMGSIRHISFLISILLLLGCWIFDWSIVVISKLLIPLILIIGLSKIAEDEKE